MSSKKTENYDSLFESLRIFVTFNFYEFTFDLLNLNKMIKKIVCI